MPPRILIIGGGFTGLTAAYRLSREPGWEITLAEAADHLGGLAAGFPFLGTSLEKAYHHLFLTDTSILQLVDELGLNDRLIWCESSVGIYRGGRIYPFMSPADLLRYQPCSFAGRLRLGAAALYLKHKKNWRGLAAQPAHDWMTAWCGRSAMESVWTPLLKGKFDRYYDTISMAWLWARIHLRAHSRGPGGREKLGYFRGGFAEVVRRLESEIIRHGVKIRRGARVEGFSGLERSARIDGQPERFDACIFTGPSPAFAQLLPVDRALEAYARQLQSIEYLGAICLVFASEQNLGDYYWINVNEPDAPFLVFLNHTRLVSPSHYQGKYVYYLGAYRPLDSPSFALSDDGLAQGWWAYLKKMFPEFNPSRVCERHVFRFKAAQHIADTGYERKIPGYRTPLPGVFLSNFSQVFPEDRGTNFAVREGLKIADKVREEMRAGLMG